MLVIERRVGQRILVGDAEITVLEISRKAVRLAVRVAAGVRVLRGEVADRAARETKEKGD